jgi:hypothetical protein
VLIIALGAPIISIGVALLSLLTIPLGVWAGRVIQVGALLALFAIVLGWERATASRM